MRSWTTEPNDHGNESNIRRSTRRRPHRRRKRRAGIRPMVIRPSLQPRTDHRPARIFRLVERRKSARPTPPARHRASPRLPDVRIRQECQRHQTGHRRHRPANLFPRRYIRHRIRRCRLPPSGKQAARIGQDGRRRRTPKVRIRNLGQSLRPLLLPRPT